MRQSFFTLANIIFLLLGISFYCQSQIAKSTGVSKEPEGKFKHNKLYRNEVNIAARRDFLKRYKNVSDEKWIVNDAGITASFSIGEIGHSVCYDENGNWLFTTRRYSEKYLSKNMSRRIKKAYDGYIIKGIEETQRSFNNTVYLVLVENETKWIKLKMKDEVMIECERINK